MTTLRGRLQRVMADHRAAVILALSLIALVLAGIAMASLFGPVRAVQVLVTLIVPGLVMALFWRAARSRIRLREAEIETSRGAGLVYHQATSQLLSEVTHELTPHLERCSLRAESLVVAVDYQELGIDLKVVVPDIEATTDPGLLRQILHVFVSNAVRHGGSRVAIWAAVEDGSVRITVSDDGAGMPEGIGDRVFQRFVDLASVGSTRRHGSGLAIATSLAGLIGGEASYRRDSNWSHFAVTLPIAATGSPRPSSRVPVRAGTR